GEGKRRGQPGRPGRGGAPPCSEPEIVLHPAILPEEHRKVVAAPSRRLQVGQTLPETESPARGPGFPLCRPFGDQAKMSARAEGRSGSGLKRLSPSVPFRQKITSMAMEATMPTKGIALRTMKPRYYQPDMLRSCRRRTATAIEGIR